VPVNSVIGYPGKYYSLVFLSKESPFIVVPETSCIKKIIYLFNNYIPLDIKFEVNDVALCSCFNCGNTFKAGTKLNIIFPKDLKVLGPSPTFRVDLVMEVTDPLALEEVA